MATTPEKTSLGLYCHVPFCAHKCSYCAFYQEPPTNQSVENYLRCISKEAELLGVNRGFDTIYVGGGTPGILTTGNMQHLCKTLAKNNKDYAPEEFSIEFSPMTVKEQKIEILKSYGCNRITIGVQTFNEKTMKALGRRQNNKQVFAAYETIIKSGIENIGIDLIFGTPGQTVDDWILDLNTAISLQPKHISTYNLTFEDDTPLKNDLLCNKTTKKSNDEEADFYIKTWDFLKAHGYEQYEISNFCIPGYESRHNINTWKMQQWIGIGPSACSQINKQRFSNPASIQQWETSIKNNRLAHTNVEDLSEKTLAEDTIIFGFRMNNGININSLKNKFNGLSFSQLDNLFSEFERENLLRRNGEFVYLTTKGMLISDTIAVNILEIF